MCTVTFLPYNKREFILTSNRDEDINRLNALPVQEYEIHGRKIFFPKDQKANGTWIAYDVKGYTLCLLNGAVEAHVPKSFYKKSRGLVLLDFYFYNEPEDFVANYDFNGLEPFTLLFVYSCDETDRVKLYELTWDESTAKLISLDSTLPQIWSSVTLYSEAIISARKQWFDRWLHNNNRYTSDGVLFFHHFAGEGETNNDLIMNRGAKKTVSICCINKSISFTDIIYEDLISKKLHKNKVINC